VLQAFPVVATGQDVVRLTDYLAELKQKVPDVSHATLLVDPDVDYDTIVQVMDAARVKQTVAGGKVTREPLFPQIALGDAPT
jgi:biopolymer transport protein ExbD